MLCRAFVVAFGISPLAACAYSAANSAARPSIAACSEAIYTTPANAPPKPGQAIRIGSAVFNSLAHLTTRRGIDLPSKRLPFYTVKSPLTILAQPRRGVIVTLVGGKDVALVYDRLWLRRLSAWRFSFAQVPRRIGFSLCRETRTKLPLNTQYAGGFLLRKLGCTTIQVQLIGETRAHRATVPIGVPHC